MNEWVNLMGSWEVRYSTEVYHQALVWAEGRRDTALMRKLVDQQLARGAVEVCLDDPAPFRVAL